MKRAHGHLAFALVAAALGVLTAGEALRLQHAQRINMAVAEWATTPISDPRAADHLPPEARLARAVALSRLDYDGAREHQRSTIADPRMDLP